MNWVYFSLKNILALFSSTLILGRHYILQTQADIIITLPSSPCLVLSPDLDVSLHQLGLPHGLTQLQSLNTGKIFSLDIFRYYVYNPNFYSLFFFNIHLPTSSLNFFAGADTEDLCE